MELREEISWINEQLIKEFGLEFNKEPRWRVVFSEDQIEKRWTDRTNEGFELLYPEVRELPKYRQYIRQRYILERLVPVTQGSDLTTKISYEPAWVFQDRYQNYLPPFFEGCKYVIEAIYSQINKQGTHAKYKDPNATIEDRQAAIEKMELELFGNETDTTDALAYGSGVVNPGINSEKTEETPVETGKVE